MLDTELNLIDRACSMMELNRANHIRLLTAIGRIRDFVREHESKDDTGNGIRDSVIDIDIDNADNINMQ